MLEIGKGTYLKLYLGGKAFAVPSECVQEIVADAVISEMPSANPWVYGILYYKKEMIPLLKTGEGEGRLAVICKYGEHKEAYLATLVAGFVTITEKTRETNERGEEEDIFLPDLRLIKREMC